MPVLTAMPRPQQLLASPTSTRRPLPSSLRASPSRMRSPPPVSPAPMARLPSSCPSPTMPAATETALGGLGIEEVVILGGTAAVGDDVQSQLEDIVGAPAIRVAGNDRFETAVAVADFGVDNLGWGPNEALLANGLNFPDALS